LDWQGGGRKIQKLQTASWNRCQWLRVDTRERKKPNKIKGWGLRGGSSEKIESLQTQTAKKITRYLQKERGGVGRAEQFFESKHIWLTRGGGKKKLWILGESRFPANSYDRLVPRGKRVPQKRKIVGGERKKGGFPTEDSTTNNGGKREILKKKGDVLKHLGKKRGGGKMGKEQVAVDRKKEASNKSKLARRRPKKER